MAYGHLQQTFFDNPESYRLQDCSAEFLWSSNRPSCSGVMDHFDHYGPF